MKVKSSAFFSGNAWERRSQTFSSQTLFISVFNMDFTWMCNTNVIELMRSRISNAFLNLFPRRKALVKSKKLIVKSQNLRIKS